MPVTEVEGRRLPLTRLEKVIYPDTGTTKGEVLRYYAQHAGTLLPHLHGRPLSLLRYPDGPGGQTFFTKRVPPGTPSWVSTCEVPRREGGTTVQVMVQDLASLMWAANLMVEFHTPQWLAEAPGEADRLILDLDPGAPADIVSCCRVAEWLHDRMTADGLRVHAKTSGSKGLHLLSPLRPAPARLVSAYARRLAAEAAAELPGLAITTMARSARPGRVFIDYSQNAAAKTTAAPYTLRARTRPAVSAPVTWQEVGDCTDPRELHFELPDIAGRVEQHGDLLAGLLDPLRARPLP
ncbi:non-homologous end-joining DNA ligase [Streptomyces sp. ACA25]|uniref:non-homologous end-joining DNA ligase n=1 Tax=Streptomyces sp. ACA25 TaxID=3022596 RepID=UPI002307D6F0|nr:non-homologous end-joining DNA ligase [Streptomyces sp. ACA25]MDB1088990.1 non-homologous end-joining DNA ligase [Streptomyces sp. ACA25]